MRQVLRCLFDPDVVFRYANITYTYIKTQTPLGLCGALVPLAMVSSPQGASEDDVTLIQPYICPLFHHHPGLSFFLNSIFVFSRSLSSSLASLPPKLFLILLFRLAGLLNPSIYTYSGSVYLLISLHSPPQVHYMLSHQIPTRHFH